MKKSRIILASLIALSGSLSLQAQVCQPDELAFLVKQEGLSNSQVRELSEFMTDLMGSRLAASQMKLRAESLLIERLGQMGFTNPRADFATEFAKGGWDVEKTYAAMTAPYYCAFSVNPKAWTGSTAGLVKGECVVVNASTVEEVEQYRGKLAGKIVLMPATTTYTMSFEPLATRYTDEQLEALTMDNRASVSTSASRGGSIDMNAYRQRQAVQKAIQDLVKSEKALCVVTGRGSFNVPGATGASYKQGDPEPTPELLMPIEDHGRMCRLIAAGHKVEMELEIKNKFTPNNKINNVLAEIPGTDPKLKDEVVLLGAHFDSWHGSTGGADNASGCIVMMEAMRILHDLGIKPKRTIRLALWGGEEQGLYGSSGYRNRYLYDAEAGKKLPGYDKFALYLNMDNGSGRFRGVYLERNDMAAKYFETWMKPLESMGFQYLSPRTTGSTDHVSFNRIGLPAFQFIQDELEYDRTYHTIMDTFERLSLDDLRIDACITAWLAICAANDPGRIPVKPGYPDAANK